MHFQLKIPFAWHFLRVFINPHRFKFFDNFHLSSIHPKGSRPFYTKIMNYFHSYMKFCSGAGKLLNQRDGVSNIVSICILWLTKDEMFIFFLKKTWGLHWFVGAWRPPGITAAPTYMWIWANILKVWSGRQILERNDNLKLSYATDTFDKASRR